MSHALLGETFDIHGGGLDLVFPHHENEIAQSECCHGQPMAKYWMHNGLMQASDERGKVGGRQTRAADVKTRSSKWRSRSASRPVPSRSASCSSGTRRRPIRFFLLATHYRRPIDFSDERIEQVHVGLDAFYRFLQTLRPDHGRRFLRVARARPARRGGVPAGQDDTLRSGGRTSQPVSRGDGRRFQHRRCHR